MVLEGKALGENRPWKARDSIDAPGSLPSREQNPIQSLESLE